MEASYIDNINITNSKSNNSNKKSIQSDLDYYSVFTPSILHDILIARIIDSYINDIDNDNDNDTSITTISDTSYHTTHNANLTDNSIRPFYHNVDGVLVCIDISQFTKLSVTLEIEQVEHIVNQIFGTLTTIVYCFGGDIIKFAGDAFYAFWKIDDESQRTDVSMMTVECCIKLREVFTKVILTNYDSIDIRICSEAGNLTFFNVGAGKRYEYLFYGQPLTDIIKADELTTKGDYVICSSLYSHVKENLTASGFELDSISNDNITCYKFPIDCVQLFNSILSDEDVQGLLSVKRDSMLQSKIFDELSLRGCKSIEKDYMKIEKELHKELSYFVHEIARNSSKDKELKTSCIIFVRIVSDIDTPNESENATNLQNYIACILSIVSEFEAKLRQYIIDDKGLVVIISVNSSRTSWLKNLSVAAIAISTALTIQKELRKKYALETVIGITKGQCLFGCIGWIGSRVEYSVIGPVVNLAARLMSANSSDFNITCDSNVYVSALSKNIFSFEKNNDLVLKGFSEPVENYTVVAGVLHDDVLEKELFLDAVKVLTSGLFISKQNIVKIGDFLFNSSSQHYVNINSDNIVVYFANLMKSMNTSIGKVRYCIIEDSIGGGLGYLLENIFAVISSIAKSYEITTVKVLMASCEGHHGINMFSGLIKNYIHLFIDSRKASSSPLAALTELKAMLQLSAESVNVIDAIYASYLSRPSQHQVKFFCEIFEKISLVFNEVLIVFIDQSAYLDSISVDILEAFTNLNLNVQFVMSHDVANDSVNLQSFLNLIKSKNTEYYLPISSTVCTNSDILKYLEARFQANELSIPIPDSMIDLITENTKRIPLVTMQIVDDCIKSYKRETGNLVLNSDTDIESLTTTSSDSFEREIMQHSRFEDLVNFNYDTMSIKDQKICKLAAVIAIRDVFNVTTLHKLIVIYFPELLQSHARLDKMISKKTLLVRRLLDSKFFKLYNDDVNGIDLFLKFNSTKERNTIYSFLPSDLKQQYHLKAANIFVRIVNSSLKPLNPFWIYAISHHYRIAGDLINAIVCKCYYAENIFSLGMTNDALKLFENAYEDCVALVREILNDDLGNVYMPDTTTIVHSIGDINAWSMFSRYSLQDMYRVCKGSNVTLFAIISIIIRYGQVLLNFDNNKIAAKCFLLAIQLFVSARSIEVYHDSENNNDNILYCQNSDIVFSFIKDTSFLIKESQINIERKLNGQVLQFGLFLEQLEQVFPSISGFFIAAFFKIGYHTQKLGDVYNTGDIAFNTLDSLLEVCRGYSPYHYMRFANLKIFYTILINSPTMLRQCSSLLDDTAFFYNYDDHSDAIISLYGVDRALQNISVGVLHNLMIGNFSKTFSFLNILISSLSKLSHLFSVMINSQMLGFIFSLLGDFTSALSVYKEIRSKEIKAPFSIFIHVNVAVLEWLIQVNDYDSGKENVDPDMEQIRITTTSLEEIYSGSSTRLPNMPFELSYKLVELAGIGYDNILGSICLMKALKTMKSIMSGTLTEVAVKVATVQVLSLCQAGLKYLLSYLDEDDNDDIASGYMIIRIQALWCKARIYNVLFQVTSNTDEQKVYQDKTKKALVTVDAIIKIFFADYDDSYIKLLNEYWKMKLLNKADESTRNYIVERCANITKDIEDMQISYATTPSLLEVIKKFKTFIKEEISPT